MNELQRFVAPGGQLPAEPFSPVDESSGEGRGT